MPHDYAYAPYTAHRLFECRQERDTTYTFCLKGTPKGRVEKCPICEKTFKTRLLLCSHWNKNHVKGVYEDLKKRRIEPSVCT